MPWFQFHIWNWNIILVCLLVSKLQKEEAIFKGFNHYNLYYFIKWLIWCWPWSDIVQCWPCSDIYWYFKSVGSSPIYMHVGSRMDSHLLIKINAISNATWTFLSFIHLKKAKAKWLSVLDDIVVIFKLRLFEFLVASYGLWGWRPVVH